MINRAEIVDRNFVAFCRQAAGQPVSARRPPDEPHERISGETPALPLTGRVLRELLESQFVSRHLDLMARELRKLGRGFYTIGSSGHEGNAVLGRLTRYSDPAFIHYRSGALLHERARQLAGQNMIRDTLLSLMAAADDPIAGGRHKVWGSVPLCVPPQTSTIASHLPKSVGAALALARSKRLGFKPVVNDHGEIPLDSIILCTFGDATVNHSVAQGAFNTACYASFQNLPAPILFVCEDNGIGISVHTASNWIEAAFSQRPGLRYFAADGLNLPDAYRVAAQAIEYVRHARRPAFLHLKVVRLLGHAGTDVETEYHTVEEIEAVEARDPLLASARLMIEAGYMSPDEVLELYEDVRRRVQVEVDALGEPRKLSSADEVVAPLAPYHADAVNAEARRPAPHDARLHAFALDGIPGFMKAPVASAPRGAVASAPRGGRSPSEEPTAQAAPAAERLPENQPPRHMAALLNWALHDLLAKYPEMLVFGEDVAAKGGVYHVTAGLTRRFGLGRVFNTLLDETSILGMALGAGHMGLLPVPEIQYLAYVHNAIDQLRGEACSTQFFSRDQFRNPLVVRIASLAYQKGFGGHFHNDNSIAALRDIPGLVLACPCRGDDAVKMLRTCLALSKVDGRVVAFLEPIALYMTRDLYQPGDGLWQFAYPPPTEVIPLGQGQVYQCGTAAPGCECGTAAPGCDPDCAHGIRPASTCDDEPASDDLTILTFGNGVYMSLRAARELREEHGVAARVVDLRWLSPLNEELIVEQARATGRVLVVDEGRHSGGVAEAILSLLLEHCGGEVVARRLTGHDTYIPLGPAANSVLPTEDAIVREATALATVSRARAKAAKARKRVLSTD